MGNGIFDKFMLLSQIYCLFIFLFSRRIFINYLFLPLKHFTTFGFSLINNNIDLFRIMTFKKILDNLTNEIRL